MRGAPHYHVLLWINKAPVIGIDFEISFKMDSGANHT